METLNIIVLMAGDAKRFNGSKYEQLKPLISVHGKSILEWTIGSLPELEKTNCNFYFAIRYDHDIKYKITEFLIKTYGENINIVRFNSLTRGNLETAFFTSINIKDKELPLLILDADNLYKGDKFFDFINDKQKNNDKFASVCYFDPIDFSPKWCFSFLGEEDKIIKLSEKDVYALDFNGKPMVGVFYFNHQYLFSVAAKKILTGGVLVKNEFFMSQSIQELIDNNINVFGFKVVDVQALGTPEDVTKYENSN